jgi:hypothetical protein
MILHESLTNARNLIFLFDLLYSCAGVGTRSKLLHKASHSARCETRGSVLTWRITCRRQSFLKGAAEISLLAIPRPSEKMRTPRESTRKAAHPYLSCHAECGTHASTIKHVPFLPIPTRTQEIMVFYPNSDFPEANSPASCMFDCIICESISCVVVKRWRSLPKLLAKDPSCYWMRWIAMDLPWLGSRSSLNLLCPIFIRVFLRLPPSSPSSWTSSICHLILAVVVLVL